MRRVPLRVGVDQGERHARRVFGKLLTNQPPQQRPIDRRRLAVGLRLWFGQAQFRPQRKVWRLAAAFCFGLAFGVHDGVPSFVGRPRIRLLTWAAVLAARFTVLASPSFANPPRASFFEKFSAMRDFRAKTSRGHSLDFYQQAIATTRRRIASALSQSDLGRNPRTPAMNLDRARSTLASRPSAVPLCGRSTANAIRSWNSIFENFAERQIFAPKREPFIP